jgi:tetratricopeptide (TPR) repeat protein
MPSAESVTIWIQQLKEGERDAVQELWERYCPQLVCQAQRWLRRSPVKVVDAEEIALSAFKSFCLVAWTCALSPNAVTGFTSENLLSQSNGPAYFTEIVQVRPRPTPYTGLVHLAQRAAAERPRDYTAARACGAILYRAGQYEAAVSQLNAAAKLRTEPSPSVWLFLAMAHHQLKHDEEARKWLKDAVTWIDEASQKKGESAEGGNLLLWDKLPWNERIVLEILRREAEKLLLGK